MCHFGHYIQKSYNMNPKEIRPKMRTNIGGMQIRRTNNTMLVLQTTYSC